MKFVGLTLAVAAGCLVAIHTEEAQVVVHTACGSARGIVRSTTAGPALAFLGIPFAEPPLGERRFKKPTRKKPLARNPECNIAAAHVSPKSQATQQILCCN
ncbi:hypothetical protein MTO96_025785 [Rhipicephalus appendiculatus]